MSRSLIVVARPLAYPGSAMTLRLVEITHGREHDRTLDRALERLDIRDTWRARSETGPSIYHFVVPSHDVQRLLDLAQTLLEHDPATRVTVIPVEAALPEPGDPTEAAAFRGARRGTGITREELRQQLATGARLSVDYLLMAVLAAVVAAIGLVSDNVAVVVGAMVIAPFLGPNLALAFATTMGDWTLGREAARSLCVGLCLAVGLSALLGRLWPDLPDTSEIAARTVYGLDALILAVASGAAAVVALTGAAPMTLVGVMVAVALLPPAVVFGIKLGALDLRSAEGAGLLLLVNIVGLNLSAKGVFAWKGITPRRWDRKTAAQRARLTTGALWLLALLVIVLLTLRHRQQLF